MAQLIVRNIEDEVVKELKTRAAEAGVSAEEYHRRILRQELKARSRNRDFLEHLLSMPDVGDDADFERPLDMGRPPIEL